MPMLPGVTAVVVMDSFAVGASHAVAHDRAGARRARPMVLESEFTEGNTSEWHGYSCRG
ncbi:hypothetical protein CITRIK5_20145 [Citricoccus sp. K5]|nr:hypothetical protein CITRIK5_20145 [Citricoccus sp. K5]